MVINESLVARTFGTYILRPFDLANQYFLVPVLGVALIVFAYLVGTSGNRSVGAFEFAMAVLKIGGITLFGAAALWAGGAHLSTSAASNSIPVMGFTASIALSILALKGFTTITNSGAEMPNPRHNVGRAIIVSIAICVIVYLLVAFAVRASLTLDEIWTPKTIHWRAPRSRHSANMDFTLPSGLP